MVSDKDKMGELFERAVPELNEVANRHGFTMRLIRVGEFKTWYLFPVVESDADLDELLKIKGETT
jgi:hypothetical protein